MPFSDRTEAGRRLARALDDFRGQDAVVLGLPRGGLPVAAEVAAYLSAPLDLLLVRKIGVPFQPELAMGALVDGAQPVIVRNEDVIRSAMISQSEFDQACQKELKEIEQRQARYGEVRQPVEVSGRTVIIIDDGIATGATARAAVQGIRKRNPRRIILAVPVAPYEAIEEVKHDADDVICLEQPQLFHAISQFYAHFHQVSHEEVIRILESSSMAARSQKPKTTHHDKG